MRMNIIWLASVSIVCNLIADPAHARTAETIEDGIRQSDSAYFATVEWYDIAMLSENALEAAGRVQPTRLLWGSLPQTPVGVPRQKFYLHMRSGPNIWDETVRSEERAQVPIIAFSSGTGNDAKVVFVLGDGVAPLPSADDVLAVRAFEGRQDNSKLREELIQAVINPQSSEVLWGYALRRLFLLENDSDRRFDLLLDSRIQTQAVSGRLYYAQALINGSRCPDYEKCELPEGSSARIHVPYNIVRANMLKLLGILENTLSLEMAEAALTSFLDDPAQKVQFSDQEWTQIRARIRAAAENPNHPFRNLPASRQARITKLLERVMREPNPFAP